MSPPLSAMFANALDVYYFCEALVGFVTLPLIQLISASDANVREPEASNYEESSYTRLITLDIQRVRHAYFYEETS